jgi:D-alanyl-D-alanine carboxypeptidase
VLAVVLAIAGVPASAFAASPPISVPAGLLMTADGHVLWSNRADQRRQVASCIKMLNALVVRERAKLDDTIVVTKDAEVSSGGSGLRAGQRLTVRQLLDAMLIHSANDAANALAIGIAGSQAKYVAMMNAKAKQIGANNTRAADPSGLSGRESSTANDLAIIARKLMEDTTLRSIVNKQSVLVPQPNGKKKRYKSSNRLLGTYRGMEGIKTGYTRKAGFCIVGAAKRDDIELIGVVLGDPSLARRFDDMRKLLDWGFAGTDIKQVVSPDETYTAQVGGKSLLLHTETTETAPVFDSGGRLERDVTTEGVKEAGDHRVATLLVKQGGYVIARAPLYAPPKSPGAAIAETIAATLATTAAAASRGLLWVGLFLLLALIAAGAWMYFGGPGELQRRRRRHGEHEQHRGEHERHGRYRGEHEIGAHERRRRRESRPRPPRR